MSYTITDLERRTARSYLRGSRQGIYARVQFTDGSSHELSRLAGETNWTVDASWGPGSFPRWCNGYGARYLITKYVTDAELVAALDSCASRLPEYADQRAHDVAWMTAAERDAIEDPIYHGDMFARIAAQNPEIAAF